MDPVLRAVLKTPFVTNQLTDLLTNYLINFCENIFKTLYSLTVRARDLTFWWNVQGESIFLPPPNLFMCQSGEKQCPELVAL